ncbi:MAG: hypothetical protein JXB32_10980 [Deltaproteobacteria bacterium]|nr:hypothetical protein [Deltaproteobacteria bacterium]
MARVADARNVAPDAASPPAVPDVAHVPAPETTVPVPEARDVPSAQDAASPASAEEFVASFELGADDYECRVAGPHRRRKVAEEECVQEGENAEEEEESAAREWVCCRPVSFVRPTGRVDAVVVLRSWDIPLPDAEVIVVWSGEDADGAFNGRSAGVEALPAEAEDAEGLRWDDDLSYPNWVSTLWWVHGVWRTGVLLERWVDECPCTYFWARPGGKLVEVALPVGQLGGESVRGAVPTPGGGLALLFRSGGGVALPGQAEDAAGDLVVVMDGEGRVQTERVFLVQPSPWLYGAALARYEGEIGYGAVVVANGSWSVRFTPLDGDSSRSSTKDVAFPAGFESLGPCGRATSGVLELLDMEIGVELDADWLSGDAVRGTVEVGPSGACVRVLEGPFPPEEFDKIAFRVTSTDGGRRFAGFLRDDNGRRPYVCAPAEPPSDRGE